MLRLAVVGTASALNASARYLWTSGAILQLKRSGERLDGVLSGSRPS